MSNQQLLEHIQGWNSRIQRSQNGRCHIFCHYTSLCLCFPICKMGVKTLPYLTGLV